MSSAYFPTEQPLRRDRVAVRHPQVRHPVQRRASHQQLRRLHVEAAGADFESWLILRHSRKGCADDCDCRDDCQRQ